MGVCNEFLAMYGYTIFRQDRDTRGGGVLLLVDNKYRASLENTFSDSTLELIHISIHFKNSGDLNVVSVYRPPSSPIADSISSFNRFLSNINYAKSPIIIMGDMNIDA